jgi:hypothetical protein
MSNLLRVLAMGSLPGVSLRPTDSPAVNDAGSVRRGRSNAPRRLPTLPIRDAVTRCCWIACR